MWRFWFVLMAGAAQVTAASLASAQSTLSEQCDLQGATEAMPAMLAAGHQGQAVEQLRGLEQCTGFSPPARFHLGSLFLQAGDPKDALRVFATVSADVPKTGVHAYAVALAQLQASDAKAAVETLLALRVHEPLDGQAENLLAVSYAKAGQLDQAASLLEKHMEQAPHELDAFLNLITVFADAGQFARARDAAARCVSAFPDQAGPLVALGAAETLLGHLDKAGQAFAEAVRLAPEEPQARFLLALTQYRKSDFSGAAAQITAARKAGVVSADLAYLQAECLLRLRPDHPELALAETAEALALDPQSVPAHTLRGKLLLDGGEPEKARVELEQAHTADPGMRSATYNLARTYQALGQSTKAKSLFQQLRAQQTSTVEDVSEERLRSTLSPQQQ